VQALVQDAQPPLDFIAAIRRQPDAKPSLIAEIKRASPSRGLICKNFDPLALGKLYQENGAKAISVLTDKQFFQGSLEYLKLLARQSSHLPLLRKDFIFDPYQIYEARAAGADAVLLIASALDIYLLKDLHALTYELGMSALVEVHHQAELEAVLTVVDPPLIGINNRDLHDFSVNIETSINLRRFIPPQICVVAESGIFQKDDVEPLANAGIDAILVGEALVSAEDVAAKVRSLALW
jgi:indole-3-glycerol phosphate synthase